MGERISTRLPDDLYKGLVAAAGVRGAVVSDMIRLAVERFLDSEVSGDEELQPRSDMPVAVPHDVENCAQALLGKLPPETRAVIEERASLLDLPISRVVMALLMTSASPIRPA
jgi:hypothetical protein